MRVVQKDEDAMVTDNEEYVSIRVAAKKLHKGQAVVRQLIEDCDVTAIRDGGSDRLPRLRVRVSEVKRALESKIYVPKGFTQREAKRPRQKSWRGVKLNPAVADL